MKVLARNTERRVSRDIDVDHEDGQLKGVDPICMPAEAVPISLHPSRLTPSWSNIYTCHTNIVQWTFRA
jgi:hypothetical protein